MTNDVIIEVNHVSKQFEDGKFAGWYNVGPDDQDCFKTGALVDTFVKHWGEGLSWTTPATNEGPHEASFLKLDCSKIKSIFGWSPRWNLDTAIDKVVEWSKCWQAGGDVKACMDKQIEDYLNAL